MLPTRRVCLNDLNPHLLCVLCGGYFVDATTIIECLHSFCKTCIVRFLETSKYCPICDVQVHKTRPLQNIRSDQTLQDIVYKLVPGLFQNEMRFRREFYARHADGVPTSKEDAGEVSESCYIYSADEPVSLSLQYLHSDMCDIAKEEVARRYLRCPAAVTIAHLQKLLRAKHGLTGEHRVDICHEKDKQPLTNNFSLMDVAYIHQWKRKGPMHFYYQIFERPCKRQRLENNSVNEECSITQESSKTSSATAVSESKAASSSRPTSSSSAEPSGEEWKEVQLQISEAGIMKVTNLAAPMVVASETIISSGRVDNPAQDEEMGEQSKTENAHITSHQKSDINGNKKDSEKIPVTKANIADTSVSKASIPCINSTAPVIAKKQTVDASKEQKTIVSNTCSTSVPSLPAKEELPPKQVVKERKLETAPVETIKTSSLTPIMKKPVSTSVGYKTLKTPPKSWNPSVSRGSYMTNHTSLSKSAAQQKTDGEKSESSRHPSNVAGQSKPPRFFKERDRPRFLGNPLSGVKPMYPLQSELDSKATPPVSTHTSTSSSMIKIDPKTLSPMPSKLIVTSHSTNNNHISCNTITTATGTVTTTVASNRNMSNMKSTIASVPTLPPILHPPPNPMLFNYTGLINSPLIRPPLMSPNAPHPFPPYPLPQSMFYGSQFPPRFQHSPPAVQRVPANVHPQKSPPIPVTSLPNDHQQSPSTHVSKNEIPKVNGEVTDKTTRKETSEKSAEAVKPKKTKDLTSTVVNNNNNNNNNNNGIPESKPVSNGPSNETSETFNKSTATVAPKVMCAEDDKKPESSKSVPPIASSQAQASK